MRAEKPLAHWNYFQYLENDIVTLSRWIELNEANLECFSLELARLLMVTCAEVDVVAKLLCDKFDPLAQASTIGAYQSVIVRRIPKIAEAEVTLPKFGLRLCPWSAWSQPSTPPLWWQAHNKVKHHRSTHFAQATLGNTLNAAAGLQLLLLLYYAFEQHYLHAPTSLFEPGAFAYRDRDLLVVRDLEKYRDG